MNKAIFRFCAIAGLVLGSVAALSAQRVVSKYGAARVQGRQVIVHVWVVVPPGLDENEVALEALRGQGARPFQGDEFTTLGLVWDGPADGVSGNDEVTQYYNPTDDPTGGAGELALTTTQDTWTAVSDSAFAFSYGGTTGRCPSLVRECQGPQTFDGFNDVAWKQLGGCCTLGVTWFGTSMDEADMALNTKFNWTNDYDPETVFLHENGHVVGLGHSDDPPAVMEAYYGGEERSLYDDDIAGITSLYPAGCVASSPDEIGLCSDGIDNDCDGLTDCDDSECPTCLDGVADCGEICDGADLGGVTCEDLGGFSSGGLACDGAASCGAFDFGGCIACVGTETSCDDSIDNDCDGFTDCDDTDCDFDLACQDDGCINPGGLGAGETCTADGDCCLDKCKGGGPQGKSCKE